MAWDSSSCTWNGFSREFYQFADRHGYRGPLNASGRRNLRMLPNVWRRPTMCGADWRFSTISPSFGAATRHALEIPPRPLPHPGYRRKVPYIYSDAEVRRLMSIARSLRTTAPLIGESQATLIGLMASTGLRTGEAIGLRDQDVLWNPRSNLRVGNGKGRLRGCFRSPPSTLTALHNYTSLRNRTFPGHSSGALFNGCGEK